MILHALSGAYDSVRDSLLRRLGERSEWIRDHARADRELQVTTTRYLCMFLVMYVRFTYSGCNGMVL